jgi:hypothetical protein
MTRRDDTRRDPQAATASRRARLHRLLFAGAALGTTLLMLGATFEPKVPHLVGE